MPWVNNLVRSLCLIFIQICINSKGKISEKNLAKNELISSQRNEIRHKIFILALPFVDSRESEQKKSVQKYEYIWHKKNPVHHQHDGHYAPKVFIPFFPHPYSNYSIAIILYYHSSQLPYIVAAAPPLPLPSAHHSIT